MYNKQSLKVRLIILKRMILKLTISTRMILIYEDYTNIRYEYQVLFELFPDFLFDFCPDLSFDLILTCLADLFSDLSSDVS